MQSEKRGWCRAFGFVKSLRVSGIAQDLCVFGLPAFVTQFEQLPLNQEILQANRRGHLSSTKREFLVVMVTCHPRCAVVGPVPGGRATVFAYFVADVLDAAQQLEDLAAGAAVFGAELAGEALHVAGASAGY